MHKIKRFLLLISIGIGGLLLTLAGLSLIELTQTLTLYVGISLLLIAGLVYFWD